MPIAELFQKAFESVGMFVSKNMFELSHDEIGKKIQSSICCPAIRTFYNPSFHFNLSPKPSNLNLNLSIYIRDFS